MNECQMSDELFMGEALKLALKGTGYVSPNPRVGAVIVRNGEIIGKGWHKAYGSAHAEIEAINNAGLESFEDCTIYVNLEPCAHHGKTPPCVDTLIEKKFSRVVIGMEDPNPQVAGKGIEKLQSAGIEVTLDTLHNDCLWINRSFSKHITTNLPYLAVKSAQTLDGFIATQRGESKWITSEESRKAGHALRATFDAVMVGKNTASVDNPQLTVRHSAGRNPWRVVLDTKLSLPLGLNIFTDEFREKTIVACSAEALQTRKANTLTIAGVKLLDVRIGIDGRIDVGNLLSRLSSEFNIASVLCEGGAETFSAFAEANLIDEMHIFSAPIIIGTGISAFSKYDAQYLKQALRYKIVKQKSICGDLHIIAVKSQT